MAGIQEYLNLIKNAIYGKDVRQAIHDGILQCYLDASGDHYERLDRNKVNQPLDGNNQPVNGTSGQLLRTRGNGATEWADVGLPTDEQTAQAVSDWLDEHPEATTTVQDGSLTLVKFKPDELPFVTPEQYGAIGDGIIDDTSAWQQAVDSGFNVKATKKNYKCGEIAVTKNIEIDCNGAEFTSIADKLFYCCGKVVTTLSGEDDYTANQIDYAIQDASYADYTGIAMLKGTNNFELARDYYLGGFACEFYEGAIAKSYPIDVTDVSLEIIDPITIRIKNIGNIVRSSGSFSTESIVIKYGYNCIVENSNIYDSGSFAVIIFDSCLNCVIDRCNINSKFPSGSTITYSYLVALLNSSFCSVKNCYMYNKDWHCVTTGDSYLCYHNTVDNCMLYSDMAYAFADHENALNTIITNSVCAGINIAGMGIVENCNIVSNKNTYRNCLIRLMPTTIRNNAVYSVRNIKFLPDSSANSTYVGVWVAASPQTSGNQYYYKDCVFENLMVGNAVNGLFLFSMLTGSNYKIENISIKKTNLSIRLGKISTETNIDISDYLLSVKDCHIKNDAISRFITIGLNTSIFNTIIAEDVEVHDFLGTATNVILNNFKSTNVMTGNSITGKLRGSGIQSKIYPDVLLGCSEIHIDDLYNTANVTWMNVSKSNDGKIYYQRYIGSVATMYEVTQ